MQDELCAIKNFAEKQALEIEDSIKDLVESFHQESLKRDAMEYRKISELAQIQFEKISCGMNSEQAQLYLQLLRNEIYEFHVLSEDLIEAGIKNPSKSMWSRAKDMLSFSSNMLIKCGATITAVSAIYRLYPLFYDYLLSDTCAIISGSL